MKKDCLLYLGVCLALLPILLLRDFTPTNELRYLSIAEEALHNHTFFTFTNHGLAYADKPPLYLWAVMLCRWLTGEHHMWLLTLLSLIPALGIVYLMNRWTAQEMDRPSRTLAGLMLLTSGIFMGATFILRMDMLMCFFIVLALHAFWQLVKTPDNHHRYRRLFPLYLFLAIFTKGPLGLFIPLCSTTVFLILSKRIKEFFHYWGWRTWGTLLIGCSLWFGAVYMEGGGSYLQDLLFHQTIDRAIHSFHHNAPFYYYALHVWYCLAPWSLLVIDLTAAAFRPKFIRSELQLYFQTVGVTTFILLSCVSSKLQIYLLPTIPFLVYTAAMFLPRFRENNRIRVSLAVPAVAFTLALPVLAALITLTRIPYLNEKMFYLAASILTVTGACALYL